MLVHDVAAAIQTLNTPFADSLAVIVESLFEREINTSGKAWDNRTKGGLYYEPEYETLIIDLTGEYIDQYSPVRPINDWMDQLYNISGQLSAFIVYGVTADRL